MNLKYRNAVPRLGHSVSSFSGHAGYLKKFYISFPCIKEDGVSFVNCLKYL